MQVVDRAGAVVRRDPGGDRSGHAAVVEALLPEIKPPPLPMWLTMHSDVRSNPRIRRAADFLGEALVQYAAIR